MITVLRNTKIKKYLKFKYSLAKVKNDKKPGEIKRKNRGRKGKETKYFINPILYKI